MKEPEINMLPHHFVCPACEVRLEWQAKITGDKNRPIHKGQIIVCGSCSAVLRVGDSGLEKMSKKQLKALDKNEKSILKMAVSAIIMHQISQQGKG